MSTLAKKIIELPPGSVTGVGSLPLLSVDEAIRFVADWCPLLPFWPQLPNRHPGEGVIAQGLGSLATFLEPVPKPYCWQVQNDDIQGFAEALDTDTACLIPTTAAGFFAFETAFREGLFPDAVAVKAQSEGPATLSHCVFFNGQPLARQPGWLDRIACFIARQAVWQVRRLRRLGKPVIFVLDEPAISLALAGVSHAHASEIVAAVNRVLHAVRETGAIAGLHCCAPLPLALVEALNLDLISFDSHLPLDGEHWHDLARSVIARSGYLAFGLVPTDPNQEPGVLELFAQWLRLAATAGDVIKVASRTIVTATCGLGLTTHEHAASVFASCQQVGDRIGQLAQAACV